MLKWQRNPGDSNYFNLGTAIGVFPLERIRGFVSVLQKDLPFSMSNVKGSQEVNALSVSDILQSWEAE